MKSAVESIALALDPVAFAAAAGLPVFKYQAEVLRNRDPRRAMLWARQTGKSTTTALLALHEASFAPGSTTLIVSPSQAQSSNLLERTRGFARNLGLETSADSATQLRVRGGGRILSLPDSPNTVRGYTADLLIADEAARMTDELYEAILPSIGAVRDSRFVALSTPVGFGGWFADLWNDKDSGYTKTKVRADQCPLYDEVRLHELRRQLGPDAYANDYLCEFVENYRATFRRADIQAAQAAGVDPWDDLLPEGVEERWA